MKSVTKNCTQKLNQKRIFGLNSVKSEIPCTNTISDSDDNEIKINEKKIDEEIGITNNHKNYDFEVKNTDSIFDNKKNKKNSFFLSLHEEPKNLNKTKKSAINPFIIPHINNTNNKHNEEN